MLVEDELLTQEQVAEALRAQVMWGGRLGTNLVELGYVTLDDLTRALGRQHGLPAALKSHFQRGESSLQRRLSARLAEKHSVVPIMRAGKGTVIASLSPLTPGAQKEVCNELGCTTDMLVQSIAAELRIRFMLEKLYRVERDPRFMRANGTRSEDSQVFQLAPKIDPALEAKLMSDEVSVVDGVPTPVARPNMHEESDALPPATPEPAYDPNAGERRRYLKTLSDLLKDHPEHGDAILRTKRMARREHVKFNDLQNATQRIFAGADREAVASRAIDAIEQFLKYASAAMLLVVRGKAAVSWTGFCRDETELPAIAVPLEHKGLFPAALSRKITVRGESGNLNALDYLLLASLGSRFGDLVVAPVKVGEHIIAVFALAKPSGVRLDGLEEIAEACGAGFARLMRDAAK
jgi:hypothetical protein